VEEWEEEWAEQGKTFPYLLALFGFLEAVDADAKGVGRGAVQWTRHTSDCGWEGEGEGS